MELHNFMFLGSPGSQFQNLQRSLHRLGMRPLAPAVTNQSADVIHKLFFQEAGISPWRSPGFPPDWHQHPATANLRKRLGNLLRNQPNTTPWFLADPYLSYLWPIWDETARELGIPLKWIRLVGEPISVTHNLVSQWQIDPEEAIRIWVNCMNYTQAVPRPVQIPEDQLIRDPVSNMKEALAPFPSKQQDWFGFLHDFIGNVRENHVSESLLECPNRWKQLYRDLISDSRESASKSSFPSSSFDTSLISLPQPYLRARREDTVPSQKLELAFYFQNAPTEPLKEIQLVTDRWEKIEYTVDRPSHLRDPGLNIQLLSSRKILTISAIHLKDAFSGKLLFPENNGYTLSGLTVEENGLRIPHPNQFTVLPTADNCSIRMVRSIQSIRPLRLELWVKAWGSAGAINEGRYLVVDREHPNPSGFAKNLGLLNDESSPRLLKPLWPEKLGNSTPSTLSYLDQIRTQIAYTRKRACSFNFRFPAYLVSFPRSGSNFLQNVIQESTGLFSCSIYSPRPADPNSVFTFKSHALSPSGLKDEIQRYYGRELPLDKIIVLKRDPRDVMCSFFEFVSNRKQVSIPQEDFLDAVSFEFAFDNTPASVLHSKRKVDLQPFSIAQAFAYFAKSWLLPFQHQTDNLLMVSYEDLVLDPKESFQRIFDFLGISDPIKMETLKRPVSRYSDEIRPRGVAAAWKDNPLHKTLIKATEKALRDLILKLDYPL